MCCHSARLVYGGPNAISDAVSYAQFFSRSHNALIRVYDEACHVIVAHEHARSQSKSFALPDRRLTPQPKLHSALLSWLATISQSFI
jgi:hypothetical protein